jgi:hypothetical protein
LVRIAVQNNGLGASWLNDHLTIPADPAAQGKIQEKIHEMHWVGVHCSLDSELGASWLNDHPNIPANPASQDKVQ